MIFQWIRKYQFQIEIEWDTQLLDDIDDIDDFIFDWIDITNATDSTKVDFSNGVTSTSCSKLPNLCPGVCRWTEEKHLQTKARHHTISQRILNNTSSLQLYSSSNPPVTTSCWFNLAALRPVSALGKIYSALNNTFEWFI